MNTSSKYLLFLGFLLFNVSSISATDSLFIKKQLEETLLLIDCLAYDQALNLSEDIIEYLKKDEKNPLAGEAFLLKGDAQYEKGKYEAAITSYRKAENIFIEHLGKQDSSLAQSYNNLGLCFMAQRNIDDSEVFFQKALQLRLQIYGSKHPKVADSYNNLGNCALNQSDISKGYDYYQKALNIRLTFFGAAHADVASSLNNLGHCHLLVRDYEQASRFFKKSLEIRKDIFPPEHPKIIQSYQNLAELAIQKDQLTVALTYLQTASNSFKKNENLKHPDLAETYTSLGIVYSKLGNAQQALSYFEEALQILLTHFKADSYRLFPIYNNIANSYLTQGDYKKAVIYFQNNLPILLNNVDVKHPHIADTYNNLGNALASMQQYNEAFQNYQAAAQIYIGLEDAHSLGINYNNTGNLFWKKEDFENAISYYEQSLQVFKTLYHADYVMNASIFNNLGNCFQKMKAYSKAHNYYIQAIQIVSKNQGKQSAELIEYQTNLALNYYENEKLNAAIETLDTVFAHLNIDLEKQAVKKFHVAPIPILSALNAKATCLLALYAKEKTHSHLKAALNLFDFSIQLTKDLRKQYQLAQSQRLLGKISYQSFEGALKVCYELFQQTATQSYIEKAFAYSEQSKSSVLLENINTQAAIQFANIPDSLIAKEIELKTQIAFYEKKQQEILGTSDEKNIKLTNEYHQKIFALSGTYNQLIEQFEKDYPKYYQVKYETTTVPLKDIQNTLLKDNEAIIEYFESDSILYCFFIKKDKIDFKALPVSLPILVEQVNLLRKSIHLPHTNASTSETYEAHLHQYNKTAHFLYQQLVAPLEAELPEKIRIISSGLLNLLPFETLLYEENKNIARLKSYPYLLKKYEISYAYSATLLQKIQEINNNSFSKKIIAFAPHFEQNNNRGLSPLENNALEINAVQNLFKGDFFTKSNASVSNFKTQSPHAQIIHLATHGKSNARSGDYSFLAFSTTADSTEADVLYAKDIYNLPIQADLVLLSACETGQGELYKDEGIISLGNAFFYAGAKSIISSLWSVDDASTRKLVALFYQNLKKGKSKSAALRQAKLEYLSQTNQPHPFFWAAFIANGDMKAIGEERFLFMTIKYLGLSLLIIILGILFFNIKNL